MSGLLLLAKHARDRGAAGGNARIRAHIFPISAERPTGLGDTRNHGFLNPLGDRLLTVQPLAAEAAAELDDLAQPGAGFGAAGALLVNETGQAFGVAEMASSPAMGSCDGHLLDPHRGPLPDVEPEHLLDVVLHLVQTALDAKGSAAVEDAGARRLTDVQVRLPRLDLQRDHLGPERPPPHPSQGPALQLPNTCHAMVSAPPAQRGNALNAQ